MGSDVRKKKLPKAASSSSPVRFPLEPSLNSLPSSKADFVRLIVVLSIATAVAVTCNFIAASLNQPPKPFCDTEPIEFLHGSCEPCPENGICHNGKFECRHGYKKKGKLCAEDGDINKAAKQLEKWVEVHLCEACTQFLCSGTGSCWVTENELWNNLDEYKLRDNHGLEEAIYTASKERAAVSIQNIFETRRNDNSIEEFKCPELLVNHYQPLTCVVRLWIIDHAILLFSSSILFTGCLLIVFKVHRKHLLSIRAEQLYDEVCDILEEKSMMPGSRIGESESWVVASWLRDHLLTPKERKDPSIWRKVQELVQEDSRIDQYPKLVKGESKVVWEWQVEGSLSSGRKKRSDGSASKSQEFMNSSSIFQRKMHAA